MTLVINGRTLYSTAEACRLAGISKPTFLRWVKEKRIPDVGCRDRNGWRLFTYGEVRRLKKQANGIQIMEHGK